jgi:hypothetical protein
MVVVLEFVATSIAVHIALRQRRDRWRKGLTVEEAGPTANGMLSGER